MSKRFGLSKLRSETWDWEHHHWFQLTVQIRPWGSLDWCIVKRKLNWDRSKSFPASERFVWALILDLHHKQPKGHIPKLRVTWQDYFSSCHLKETAPQCVLKIQFAGLQVAVPCRDCDSVICTNNNLELTQFKIRQLEFFVSSRPGESDDSDCDIVTLQQIQKPCYLRATLSDSESSRPAQVLKYWRI